MKSKLTRKEFFKASLSKFADFASETIANYNIAMDTIRSAVFDPSLRLAAPKDFVRPPGAVKEAAFLNLCTKCDDCLKACPHWVIRKAGSELGLDIAGGPIILPDENPCLFCDGLPCIAACETGALINSTESEIIKIGFPVIDENNCYISQGQPCDYCMQHCPESPKAIRTLSVKNAPLLDLDRCTGCGKCAQICPANVIVIKDHRELL